MTASKLALRSAPLILLVGMGFGIFMAASQDHTLMPAHAHLNLLGFVGTLLMGLVYRIDPVVDESALAKLQIWVWLAAIAIMFVSMCLLLYGNERAEIGAKISSTVGILDAAVFAFNVFRITGKTAASDRQIGVGSARAL
jgi:uncharacterized membrane protein